MPDLFVAGAFAGAAAREAYLVKCDGETTLQQDVNTGIVNIVAGFQPLKPAEFVVLSLLSLPDALRPDGGICHDHIQVQCAPL